MNELVAQFDLSLRLLLAAALGALIGVEREIHGHPAGMRTHLLVALGSAIFTVLSIYGFGTPGQAVYYIIAVLMKLFAGRAGGRMAASMAATERGSMS